jgi:hypothetical protein
MVGMEGGAVCINCHEKGKYGAPLAAGKKAETIRNGLDGLNAEIARARKTIEEAETRGMEVSQPKFDLRSAVNALTNARTLLHSFRVEPVEAALGEGQKVTAEVQKKADAALEEYTYRRKWLAATLVPIFIVIGLLLLYIRTMPVPQEPPHS